MRTKTKWAVVGFLILGILTLSVVAHFMAPPAQAQSIGYVSTGQQSVTGSAVVVSGISYGTVCIKALSTNNISVYIGGPAVTTSTGFELTATQVPYCAQVNRIPFYTVASTTGASVSWIVTR